MAYALFKSTEAALTCHNSPADRELYLGPWSHKENKNCTLVLKFVVSGMRKCPFPTSWNYFWVPDLSGGLSVCSSKSPELSFL